MKGKNNIGTIISLLILIILVTGVVFVHINMQTEDERCPFMIAKILIISTGEGEQKSYIDETWKLSLMQINDVYVYIDENKDVKRNENEIQKVTIENFQVIEGPQNAKIDMNLLDDISQPPNLIVFRQTYKNIKEYEYKGSNVVQDGKLLVAAGITEEELKTIITFDVIIQTSEDTYMAAVTIEVPAKDLLEHGKGISETTNFKNIVFEKI